MQRQISIGVDIGGTKTAAALLSGSGEILATTTEPTDRSGTPTHAVGLAKALIVGLLREVGRSVGSLTAVGVGLPGLIRPDRIFHDSIILPTWHEVDFRAMLHAELAVPVVVDNDATMAALGHLSAIPPPQRPACLVCLTLGTGVGGAVLLDGEPLRGPDGTAGQVGHVVVEPAGRACECGSSGCLNAYASGTAIARRYVALQAESGGEPSGEVDIPGALSTGDPFAVTAVGEAVDALVTAISSVVNLFNPEVVVLGGGVANLGAALADPIRAGLARQPLPVPARRVRLHLAAQGPLTGAVGAAVAAARLDGTTDPTTPVISYGQIEGTAHEPGRGQ